MARRPPIPPLSPYTTLFRSGALPRAAIAHFEKNVWIEIINCAKNKPKETDENPDEQKTETRKKKIIRLTEAD